MLEAIFITIGSILMLVGVLPYLVDVVRGKTKPRIVSWLVWCVLTAIAGFASLFDGHYPTAILLAIATLTTLLVAILGYKHGDRRFEQLDVICFIGAAVGLLLWWLFNSPELAVIATIIIDLVGAIPTLVHSWKKPHEETWIAFFLAFLSSLCTIVIVEDWVITAIAYPLYLLLFNGLLTGVIVLRRRHGVHVKVAEPPQL